ncbi:hypothetical protein CBW65_13295 [Tumebacillus avium]|uniref:Uncharacterized protein n=1 Tax=Tumebacillus avium TaxID=1903704 RepID=A0A1Y0IMZ3_9BACL|nr:hypothetical protein [Tumebacillus avium]ARU61898.1 hypothetical protein CBW65_13295 [Tumebacillus avium]
MKEIIKVQPEFKPYQIYRSSDKSIFEFTELSELSYDISQQLLFKYPKEELEQLKLAPVIPKRENLSFSLSDITQLSMSKEPNCCWLTFEKYADKCQIPLEEIQQSAAAGKLGHVGKHPKTDEEIIIWPPEKQELPLSDLPGYGRSSFSVEVTADAYTTLDLDPLDMDNFEQVQKTYLTLAHSLGKPDEVKNRAKEILYQGSFLLQWTIFEVYLRSTIQELIKLHPTKIASSNKGKSNLSYQDLLDMSDNLTSIDAVKEKLIQREIERLQSGGASVHGLINFLKSEFKFNKDPYVAWYQFKGERHNTHFNFLIELKEVRNALMHDGGTPDEKFFTDFPDVPRRGMQILINEDYYSRARLGLNAIAYQIAFSIERQDYNAD